MYETITWLAGRTFLDKKFVGRLNSEGLDSVLKDCPYGDLTTEQRATFEAAFNHEILRHVVSLWWALYKYLRVEGDIPDATAEAASPWMP